MIIMVNKSLVKDAERPRAWKDLLDPKWKGKVVMANPEKSGSAYAQVYGIWKLYDWDGIKKLIANAKVLDSSSLIYKGVAAGEYPVGITMEYAAHRYIAGGDKNVAIVYPADGPSSPPRRRRSSRPPRTPRRRRSSSTTCFPRRSRTRSSGSSRAGPPGPTRRPSRAAPLKSIPVLKTFDPWRPRRRRRRS
jgi:hypothetical protein